MNMIRFGDSRTALKKNAPTKPWTKNAYKPNQSKLIQCKTVSNGRSFRSTANGQSDFALNVPELVSDNFD